MSLGASAEWSEKKPPMFRERVVLVSIMDPKTILQGLLQQLREINVRVLCRFKGVLCNGKQPIFMYSTT